MLNVRLTGFVSLGKPVAVRENTSSRRFHVRSGGLELRGDRQHLTIARDVAVQQTRALHMYDGGDVCSEPIDDWAALPVP